MPTEEEARLFEEMMTYKEEIFQICLGFCRNLSDAEDLAQDVYLRAYRNVGKIHSPYAVKEWLFRVARNTCLNYQKKTRAVRVFQSQARDLTACSALATPPDSMERDEQLRALKQAINRLPRKLREVFVFRMYGDVSYQELARTLRIREGTVMSRLNRARIAVTNSVKEALDGRKKG
jgi:RNA polymerase sigma-70 factor (ECF subfamily)